MQPHNFKQHAHTSFNRTNRLALRSLENNLLVLLQCHTSSIFTSQWYLMCAVYLWFEVTILTPIPFPSPPPRNCNISQVDLVSFYNRCPFQGGK